MWTWHTVEMGEQYLSSTKNQMISVDMGIGMRTVYPSRLNKELSSEFPAGYPDQETPDEGWKA